MIEFLPYKTKAQRVKVYEAAIDELASKNEEQCYSMCPIIADIISGNRHNYKTLVTANYFPELFNFKPFDATVNSIWYPRGDKDSRIIALLSSILFCIKK